MRNKTKHVLKRALAVLMSMAVVFAAIPCYPAHAETTPQETTPRVSITSESVTAGNSTTLYVKASDLESIAGLEMAVHYDADAFDVSYAWTTGLADGQVNDLNYATDGIVKYSMISVDGVSGSGYLLGINFDTTSETKVGNYPITVTVSDAYNVNFSSLSIGKNSGNITVKERTQTIEDIYFYSQVDKSSVETGEEFTYSLMTGYISDLSGGNFEFTYDAEALEVVDVSLAEALTSKTAVQSINTKKPGYIKVSYAAIEAIGANYWDKLIDITFKAKDKAYASTSIVFSTTELIGEDLVAMSASKLTNNIKITKPETVVDNPDFILYWNRVLNSDRTVYVVAKLPADTLVAAGDFVIAYDTDKLKCISAEADSAISGNGGYLVTKEDISNGKIKFSYVTTKPSNEETALLHMTFEAVDQYIGEAVLFVKGTGVVDIDYKDVILDYPDKKINIYKLSISDKEISGIDESYAYTGEPIKPEIEGLRANIDYTVTYKNNTNVGDAEVIIEGKGNYSGKVEKTFKIVPAEITSVTAAPYEGIYDGKAHGITLNGVPNGATVTYAESKDGEYTPSPIRHQNAGTKTVYYKVSKENYKDLYGSADINISAAPIDNMAVSGIEKSYTFSGSNITPKVSIEGLTEGEDYQVIYDNNVNVGIATVTINGINNYTGSISANFNIEHNFSADWKTDEQKHWHECACGMKTNENNHNEVVVEAVVPTCTETGLTEGTKCSVCERILVEQKEIAAAGHRMITHTAVAASCETRGNIGYYTCDECERYFLDEKGMNETTADKVVVAAVGHKYGAYKTTTKAKFGKNGVQTAKCTGCNKAITKSIYAPKTIKLSTTSYTYNGKAKKPTVAVYDSKGNKISASNYTVSYSSGLKNVGKYKVSVSFKTSSASYTGSSYTTFKINPKGTSISKLTKGKKSFSVKWKKQSGKMATSRITGYQYRYSTSSKMTSAKTVTVKGYKKTSAKKTKLKAKKKYYVQVRTYKTVSGTKYYSSWSKTKSVTTK